MITGKIPEEEIIIKHKKRRLWYRLLMTASIFVVFITTYMLILPAITAEKSTINIFDEVVSGGGAVAEEITEETTEETISEETTTDEEETTGAEEKEESYSGGSGSSSGTLADGTIISVELEKIEKEKEEEKSLFKNVLSSLTGVNITTSGSGTNGSYVCVYDPETGNFELNLTIDFEIPQNVLDDYSEYSDGKVTVNGYNKAYTITLPGDIIIPDSLLNGGPYYGYQTGTTNVVFRYYFQAIYDADGNISNYEIVMVFDDDYLDSLGENDIEGYVDLEAYISSNAYTEDGDIVIRDVELGFDIEISKVEIEFNGNETVNKDIYVEKTGSYDAETNTITYTVIVLTTKGTNDPITVKDSISSELVDELGGTLVEVSYQTGVAGLYEDEWNRLIDTYYITGEAVTINEGTGVPSYTTSDSKLTTIVLPGLGAASTNYYENWYGYEDANAHVITYTYQLTETPEAEVTYSLNNTASVTVRDDVADTDISDSDEADVTVTGSSMIQKTGSYSEDTSSITWTITVGDGKTSLEGYELTDSMFSQLTVEELMAAIKHTDGSTACETEYEILYEDGKIIGIEFSESSYTQYIIEYTTSAESSWGQKTVENEATLTPPEGNENGDYYVGIGVTVPADGDVTKTVDNENVKKIADGTYIIPWTVVVDLSEQSLTTDSYIRDYVEGTGHYITYKQALDIIKVLEEVWGADNISNIRFKGDGDNWIDADDIADGEVYYQFEYRMKVAIEGRVISYTYYTTVDTSEVYYETAYSNYVRVHDVTVGDSWTYTPKVVKYGKDSNGNISGGSSSIEATVGEAGDEVTVTWVVALNPESYTSYTITDTLPAGVTLDSLYVGKYLYGNGDLIEKGTGTTLYDDLKVEYTVTVDENGRQVIVLEVNYTNSENIYPIYITYECHISQGEDVSDGTVQELANSVKVTAGGGTEYGSSDQTIKVTWEEEVVTDNLLTKSAAFDSGNATIKFTVEINPEGETYEVDGIVFDEITITDTLEYECYYWTTNGDYYYITRDATLLNSSVKLYYAQTDEDGNILYDDDGNLIKGEEVDSADYAWTYEESKIDYGYGTAWYAKIIKLTVPNSTALIFEYEYLITGETSDDSVLTDVRNSVTAYMNGTQIGEPDGTYTSQKIEDSKTSGGANGSISYTIYKVDSENYNMTLADATFELYVYDTKVGEFVSAGIVITNSSGNAGVSGTAFKDTDGNITYAVVMSDLTTYYIPVDTMCYFVEVEAPEGYKLDTTKHYFYFGSSTSITAEDCDGGSGVTNAYNIVQTAHSEYISNEHSSDYYAEKTSLSVVKKWINSAGSSVTKLDGEITFKLYKVFVDVNGNAGQVDTSRGYNLSWNVYSVDNENAVSYSSPADSGSGKYTGEVTIKIISQNNYSGWTPEVIISDDNNILVYYKGTYSSSSYEETGEEWDAENSTFTATINVEEDTNLNIIVCDSNANATVKVTSINDEETTISESSTEVTTDTAESTETSESTTVYSLDFDGDTESDFFNVSWDNVRTGMGTVVYNENTYENCFVMNSDAEIEFTATEEGVLYMVFTNPYGSSSVGAVIDDEEHYAVVTGDYDSNGNAIYLLTARVTEGNHKIERISRTQVMLYYMEYIPDNYGDGEKSEGLNLPEGYEDYAELVGEYTLNASNGWAMNFSNLEWQVLDDDGSILGYYKYYVVENDGEEYLEYYINNSGVDSGTIGIYNQQDEETTKLKVIKKWIYDGKDDSASHSDDEISFNLYARIVSDSAIEIMKSESYYFSSSAESDFYTVKGTTGTNSSEYGNVTYDGTYYGYCLIMDENGSLEFDARATGTLTLVFSDKSDDVGFVINDDTYKYNVSTGILYVNGYESDDNIVTYDNGAVIFNLSLSSTGDYEVKGLSDNECYLFYVNYLFNAAAATDGVLIGSYTISADDGWERVIEDLPKYATVGNTRYEYFIVETYPDDGYSVAYAENYEDEGTCKVITVTNTRETVNVELPETGGKGSALYSVLGVVVLGMAGMMMIKRRRVC